MSAPTGADRAWAMARKPISKRNLRRGERRRIEKLRDDLERLARLEPGGAGNNPAEIESPAQVEARVRATPCPICQGRLDYVDHMARTVDGRRLRVADCRCVECGTERSFYFALRTDLQS